jgi:6-pyruvoyltetrahydropterin/6-carboxytetrahydropterin synthase
MRVVVRGKGLYAEGPQTGMLQDYGRISKAVNPLIETHLDHHYLNGTTNLEDPTSENLAAWVFSQLRSVIPELVAIEIDETCTSSCRYEPD